MCNVAARVVMGGLLTANKFQQPAFLPNTPPPPAHPGKNPCHNSGVARRPNFRSVKDEILKRICHETNLRGDLTLQRFANSIFSRRY